MLWAIGLNVVGCLLGLSGCSHPQPPPLPSQFLVEWKDPNVVPPCATPPAYPCQVNQSIAGANVAIGTTTYTLNAIAGNTYQLVINEYNPSGVLVSSKPVQVIIP